MENVIERPKTKTQKWGWGILIAISALMVLNGVTWFFSGPNISQTYLEQEGVPMKAFTQSYPIVAMHMGRNARQVAVWYLGFGLLSFLVALEGLRHGPRRVWYATWVLVGVPIAIGLVYLPGARITFDNAGLFLIGAITLVGQLLAGKRP